MLYEHGMLNDDSLMKLFTEMYLSGSISDDNIPTDWTFCLKMCIF